MDEVLKKRVCQVFCDFDIDFSEDGCSRWENCQNHKDIEQAFLDDGWVKLPPPRIDKERQE
jgi:hypothetical protein